MSKKSWQEMGFKCGLEIHQQLKTDEKLFCNCPSGYRNDPPDAEIIRHMRPTLSELGEYDGTALMEFKTKKRVIYQLYRDNMCTYEMDDTPPFVINKKALDIAIRLSLMLNCAIVDELHVSRKQYLDGSIPTGFQRTAVVGAGGWVPYKGRKIELSHVCLEEDACREVADEGHDIIFRTDRLSMPLLEVITKPVLESPQEARDVNELIGRMLKASGLVRRGIGSVRQDVNVSITGSTRVEMKGISKTGYIDKMTAIEAYRQRHLLEIKEELKSCGLTKEKFTPVKKDVTSVLKGWPSVIIASTIESGNRLGAVKLPGFAGLLKREIQPGRTFADEFAGRVKVIACLDKMPNIAVSEMPLPDIVEGCWRKLADELKASDKDVIILTWGAKRDVETAMNEIVIRAQEAFDGVPNETRQHLDDYTTGFERILPGPDRMYPDTDSPPVVISSGLIDSLKKQLPAKSWDYEQSWIKSGTPEILAKKIVVTPLVGLFDRLVQRNTVNPSKVFAVLKNAYGANKSVIDFNAEIIADMFDAECKGRISFKEIAKLLADSRSDELQLNFEKLLKDRKEFSVDDICKAVDEVIQQTKKMEFRNDNNRLNYLTGQVVRKFDGVVNGGRVKEMVKQRV